MNLDNVGRVIQLSLLKGSFPTGKHELSRAEIRFKQYVDKFWFQNGDLSLDIDLSASPNKKTNIVSAEGNPFTADLDLEKITSQIEAWTSKTSADIKKSLYPENELISAGLISDCTQVYILGKVKEFKEADFHVSAIGNIRQSLSARLASLAYNVFDPKLSDDFRQNFAYFTAIVKGLDGFADLLEVLSFRDNFLFENEYLLNSFIQDSDLSQIGRFKNEFLDTTTNESLRELTVLAKNKFKNTPKIKKLVASTMNYSLSAVNDEIRTDFLNKVLETAKTGTLDDIQKTLWKYGMSVRNKTSYELAADTFDKSELREPVFDYFCGVMVEMRGVQGFDNVAPYLLTALKDHEDESGLETLAWAFCSFGSSFKNLSEAQREIYGPALESITQESAEVKKGFLELLQKNIEYASFENPKNLIEYAGKKLVDLSEEEKLAALKQEVKQLESGYKTFQAQFGE